MHKFLILIYLFSLFGCVRTYINDNGNYEYLRTIYVRETKSKILVLKYKSSVSTMVSGTVISKRSKKSVGDLYVYFTGLGNNNNFSAYTDSLGRFSTWIYPGEYKFGVRPGVYSGFSEITQKINIKHMQELQIDVALGRTNYHPQIAIESRRKLTFIELWLKTRKSRNYLFY